MLRDYQVVIIKFKDQSSKLNKISMSQKRKAQRARHEAEVAKKGKDVVMWIIIALIVFALIFLVINTVAMM